MGDRIGFVARTAEGKAGEVADRIREEGGRDLNTWAEARMVVGYIKGSFPEHGGIILDRLEIDGLVEAYALLHESSNVGLPDYYSGDHWLLRHSV